MSVPRARDQRRPPPPPDRLPSPRGGHPSPSTASAAKRRAGFARLAGGRRGLVHSVRTLAAVALLALVGGLALPATTQAQAPSVLVSNMGQADSGPGNNINDTWLAAQSFWVPSGGGNYTLTSIEIRVTQDISSTNIGSLTVTVWSADSSGHPVSSLHTLTNPASVTAEAAASFTAPASATLEAGNTYVVLVDADLSGNRNWMSTNANSEDATSTTGWFIGNTGLYRGRTATSWTNRGSAFFLQVNGTVSNNAPVFADGTATREVPENSAADTAVGAPVTADDADTGDTLEYSLGGTDASSFEIDSDTGQIKTVSSGTYNYEAAQNSYSVTVTASDGTDTDSIVVTINLTDVDEQPDKPAKPTVTAVSGSSTSLDVSWTQPGLNGGPEITGYEVRYETRASPTDLWIAVGNWPHTGTTTTTTITGLTATTEYQVQVTALNGEIQSAWSDPSDVVSTNAGSNAPVFADATATREVPENSAADTAVGAPVTADDADGDTLEYTLGGTDASSFDIDSDTGQIKTVSSGTYNYEAQNSYSVTVTASDGTDTDSIDVTINLTDVDEQPDKPDKPTVTAVSGSSTSLDVSWTEPGLNGGPAITGYQLRYETRASPTDDWSLAVDWAHTGTTTTTTITGLTANTEHRVQVAALNGEIPSAYSNNSDVVSTNAETLTAPTITEVAVTSTPQATSDTYGAGETIEVTVTFDQAVNATTGTDFVLSVAGRKRAPLLRGSGTTTLVFGYTVQTADADDNGIWIGDQDRTLVGNRMGDPQNGTITSVDTGTAADLTHSALGQQSGHKVDAAVGRRRPRPAR